MISPNPTIGTGLHAIGGVSAASCYMPFEKVKSWSWGTFWIVQALFAWLIMPFVIWYFTVPHLFTKRSTIICILGSLSIRFYLWFWRTFVWLRYPKYWLLLNVYYFNWYFRSFRNCCSPCSEWYRNSAIHKNRWRNCFGRNVNFNSWCCTLWTSRIFKREKLSRKRW